MNPNDITLIGIFDKFTNDEALYLHSHYGITINGPSHPAIVPRFNTMTDLTERMSEVITKFTNVPTDISAMYTPATGDTYGSFMVGITVQKAFEVGVSFSSSVSLGDFSTLSVEESSLVLDGSFLLSNEFGVILGPNDETGLKFLGNIKDENCTSVNQNLEFEIILYHNDDPPIYHDIAITSCAEGVAARVETVKGALNAVVSDEDATVSLVGSSLLVIAFNPYWSKVEIYVPEVNIYGLENDTITKPEFHFANGATSLEVSLGISGGVAVAAAVLDTIEVAASIDSSIRGSLDFSSGSNGQLVPISTWKSNMMKMLNSSDPFYQPGFATCTLSLDGGFGASVEVREPFAVNIPAPFDGFFASPFELDLLNISAVSIRRPDIEFNIDIPTIGDIKKLSFGDVVKILKLSLEFIIGDSESGGSVDSCSGGLLGKEIFLYEIPIIGMSVCSFAVFFQIVVDAVDQIVNDCTECNDPDAPKSTFSVLGTKLSSLLQDAVGGTPNVVFTPTSDNIRSSIEVDLLLEWSFLEAIQLNIDLAGILEGMDLDEDIRKFAKGIIGFDGAAGTDITGSISLSLGVGLEYVRQTGAIVPYLRGITGVVLNLSADANAEFQASIGALSASVAIDATIDNYGDPLSISVGLDPGLNYYISSDTRLSRNGFQRVSSIGALADEISIAFKGQVMAEIEAEIFGGLGNAFITIQISDINNVVQQKPGAVAIYYKVSVAEIPSFLDLLLLDPTAIIDAVDGLFKSFNDLTLGKQGIVTTFPLPFIGTAVSQSMRAGSPDNFLEKARRAVKDTLFDILNTYQVDDGESTVADLIANVLTDLLGDLGILNGMVSVNYYEHNDGESLTEHENFDPTLDIKSLMWEIPFGQTFTIDLPPMNFDLGNGFFPLQIRTSSTEQPTLSLTWSMKLAFGFDENDGFFLYTFPHIDPSEEESEFFVRADFNLPVSSMDAKLLYFLNLGLDDIDIAFGAGIFVNIDKSHGMRGKPDDPNSIKFGRLSIDDIRNRVPVKKDLFVICAAGKIVNVMI